MVAPEATLATPANFINFLNAATSLISYGLSTCDGGANFVPRAMTGAACQYTVHVRAYGLIYLISHLISPLLTSSHCHPLTPLPLGH